MRRGGQGGWTRRRLQRLQRQCTTRTRSRGVKRFVSRRAHPPGPPFTRGGTSHSARSAHLDLLAIGSRSSSLRIAHADDPPPPDSPLVKLLKSGRVPEARQGAIVDMIGKRGTAGDLEFIFQQAICPRRFPGTDQGQGPRRPGRSGLESEPATGQGRSTSSPLDPAGLVTIGSGHREGGGPAGGPLEARGGGRGARGAGRLAIEPTTPCAAKRSTPWPPSAAGRGDRRSKP